MSALRILTYVGAGFALLLALAFCAGRATAHEPGTEWMMDGGFRNQAGEHCCSPNRDCNVVPDSAIELQPSGLWKYLPTGEVVPKANTFRSKDPQGQHWRCEAARYWMNNQTEPPKTRCLFVAPGTT